MPNIMEYLLKQNYEENLDYFLKISLAARENAKKKAIAKRKDVFGDEEVREELKILIQAKIKESMKPNASLKEKMDMALRLQKAANAWEPMENKQILDNYLSNPDAIQIKSDASVENEAEAAAEGEADEDDLPMDPEVERRAIVESICFSVQEVLRTCTKETLNNLKKINELSILCDDYKEHLSQEISKFGNFDTLLTRDPNEISDKNLNIAIEKYRAVESLSFKLTDPSREDDQKIEDFRAILPEVTKIISKNRDSFGIKFLKACATILTLGVAVAFGIWNTQGDKLKGQLDKALSEEEPRQQRP